jgi:hypothetical protein
MFCLLEPDIEHFTFIRNYLISLNKKNVFKLDQEYQFQEIKKHCELNNKNNNEECIKWINEFSAGYREYLNSLKILNFCFTLLEKPLEEITFEDYKIIALKWNKYKDQYLEYIF